MKLAIFSDVHGNLLALERFLGETQSIVDGYICLGDVVNYGPWNDECLELVHELPNTTFLEGNHERLFLGTESAEHEIPLVQSFLRHSRQFFSRSELISNLPTVFDIGPFRCEHTIDGRSVYADTAIEIERSYIIGHSHHQFRVERSGYEIVNAGSIGQNRKWIDMVDYAIMDGDSGDLQLMSINYDVDKFIAELRARQYPDACVEYYVRKTRRNA